MRRRTRLSRGPPVASITYFKIHITESEEADNLEVLKKTTAEEQAKLNKKKKKIKAQDSVLVEAIGKSMEE